MILLFMVKSGLNPNLWILHKSISQLGANLGNDDEANICLAKELSHLDLNQSSLSTDT